MSLVCYWTCSLLTSLDCELALVLVYYSTCFLFALFGQVSFSFGLLYDPLSLSLGWSRVGFSFGMLFDLLSFSLVRLWVGFRFGLLSDLLSLSLAQSWVGLNYGLLIDPINAPRSISELAYDWHACSITLRSYGVGPGRENTTYFPIQKNFRTQEKHVTHNYINHK